VHSGLAPSVLLPERLRRASKSGAGCPFGGPPGCIRRPLSRLVAAPAQSWVPERLRELRLRRRAEASNARHRTLLHGSVKVTGGGAACQKPPANASDSIAASSATNACPARGAANADLRVPGAAAVANPTSPLPRHPRRPARPTRARQPFAACFGARCKRPASARESRRQCSSAVSRGGVRALWRSRREAGGVRALWRSRREAGGSCAATRGLSGRREPGYPLDDAPCATARPVSAAHRAQRARVATSSTTRSRRRDS
jgi:hypothetical protein